MSKTAACRAFNILLFVLCCSSANIPYHFCVYLPVISTFLLYIFFTLFVFTTVAVAIAIAVHGIDYCSYTLYTVHAVGIVSV